MNSIPDDQDLEADLAIKVKLTERPASSQELRKWIENELDGSDPIHLQGLILYLEFLCFRRPVEHPSVPMSSRITNQSINALKNIQDPIENEYYRDEVIFTTKENEEIVVLSYHFTTEADPSDPKGTNAKDKIIYTLREPGFSQMCEEIYEEVIVKDATSELPLLVEKPSRASRPSIPKREDTGAGDSSTKKQMRAFAGLAI